MTKKSPPPATNLQMARFNCDMARKYIDMENDEIGDLKWGVILLWSSLSSVIKELERAKKPRKKNKV
jgi:hypothetical protein